MTIRERTLGFERQTLSSQAALCENSKGRSVYEEECPVRTAYQRDRDRIIHSNAFRRLKDKTQVFLSPKSDHYRTRLTHTLEVSQIARTITRALGLNEDLTEAIALGHDLGHTPFGHAGERALDAISPLGFRHYEQSLRVVDVLEKNGAGLNLTFEVRDGILCHTTGEEAKTLEGRVVKLSDKIAYINHDFDDALRAGVLSEKDVPTGISNTLGKTKSSRLSTLVISAVENSSNTISLSPEIEKAFNEFHVFMFEMVYKNPICKGEEGKAITLVKRLAEYYQSNPNSMPPLYQKIFNQEDSWRAASDYIAGMSDRFARARYTELFIPKFWDEN